MMKKRRKVLFRQIATMITDLPYLVPDPIIIPLATMMTAMIIAEIAIIPVVIRLHGIQIRETGII